MVSLDVSNRGKRWSETDSERLKTLYGKGQWDLVKLAQEFKRTPCSIWSRLIQYNIIAEPEQARGYDRYLAGYAENYAALPPKPPKPNELKDDIDALQKDLQEVKMILLRILEKLTITSSSGLPFGDP